MYKKESRENKRLIWVAFICSLVFLFIAFRFLISELPDKNNIVEIHGILKSDIKVKKRGRGSRVLVIKLENYPKINFIIQSVSLGETYSQELMDENKARDSIKIFIENREYRRKIAKTEKIPFPENIFHPDKISIVEIKNSKSNYLLLKDYNKAHLKNNYLGIAFFGILGLLMILLGIKGKQYFKG